MEKNLIVPDILSFGVINLDFVMEVSNEMMGEKFLGRQLSICAGGHGLNQAIGVSRSGVTVGLIGKTGQDVLSQEVFRLMEKEHIFGGLVRRMEGMNSGMSALLNSSEDEQKIYDFPGANYSMSSEDIEEYRSYIQNTRMLIVRSSIPVCQAAKRLMEIAGEYGKSVVLICSRTLNLEDIADCKPDYLILGGQEAARICKVELQSKKVARAAASLLAGKVKKAVIVQMDEKGVLVADRQGTEMLDEDSSYTVQDYAGSLSFFSGVFAAELVKGADVLQASVKAHRAAKICAGRIGVYTSFPTAKELAAL